jgi:hypothetical protein
MKGKFRWAIALFVLIGLMLPLMVLDTQADAPFDDLTPNEYTFTGRRGTTYTATWDPSTHEITISTPDGTFPWDWTAFVNSNGTIALAGHPDVASTFRFSSASSLSGLGTGDVMRVKAWDIISLAHLTKIGLVIGSGPSAERVYLSEGTISHYILAPHFIGYEVSVLGRTVTVRLSHLAPDTLQAVGVIEIQVDDPADAYLLVASDLEPRTRYQQAVEYRGSSDTTLSFQTVEQAVRGYGGDGTEAFFYASSPLSSWSAGNLSFDNYLDADALDEDVLAGQSDGRAALKVVAQPLQHFYVGNVILGADERNDPSPLTDALRDTRLSALNQLPTLDAPDLPAFKFVLALSNLFGTYLINPDARIYYTDKAFPYAADGLGPLIEVSELLPDTWFDAYRDYLDFVGQLRYQSPGEGVYWWRADVSGNPPLPTWYGSNIPDIFYRNRANSVTHRFQYSDLYSTALYLIGLNNYYLATGDIPFVQSQEDAIRDTVSALQIFDTAYGADGNLFPHLLVPMGDLARIEGVYPAESGYTIYAYEDAAHLYQVLGDDTSAADLLDNYVAPMRADYDATFWYTGAGFFLPRRDSRSRSGSGDYFSDLWTQTMLPPLQGDIGDSRLSDLLDTFTRPQFYDADHNYRWLSTDSENYEPDYRFVSGYVMEGGFFNGVPNAVPAVASYQLQQNAQADQYVNDFYLDIWTRMGPYETMREWDTTPAGMYLEASIYIEPLMGTWWLLEEAMGLRVNGTTVTVEPRLGGQFVARNVRVTANGLSVVFDYARDATGQEYIQIISNEGLTVVAPNVSGDNDAPVVSGIPDQTINMGQSFTTINLDDYVSDDDNTDAQMTWTYSGNISLTVSIDANRVATITAPSSIWNGSEGITFTAEDPGHATDGDSATFTVRPRHSLTLQPGWNLVSFNLQPVSTVITDVLSSIAGKYDLVYAWDASVSSDNWKLYDDTSGQPNPTLSTLDEKQGFWINITAASAVTLDVDGTAPGTTLIRLHTEGGNWNLVGYPADDYRALPGVLDTHGVTNFSLLYAYHANDTSNPWKLYDTSVPAWVNDLNQLDPG